MESTRGAAYAAHDSATILKHANSGNEIDYAVVPRSLTTPRYTSTVAIRLMAAAPAIQ